MLFEEVRRLNAAGVTVVYTSHYMEEVQALCTRIGIMDHGRLIACDTLPALLRADEAFTSSAVREIVPVVSIDRRELPRGDAAPRLQALLEAVS